MKGVLHETSITDTRMRTDRMFIHTHTQRVEYRCTCHNHMATQPSLTADDKHAHARTHVFGFFVVVEVGAWPLWVQVWMCCGLNPMKALPTAPSFTSSRKLAIDSMNTKLGPWQNTTRLAARLLPTGRTIRCSVQQWPHALPTRVSSPRHVRRAPPDKEDVASLTAVARQHGAAPQRLIPEYTHVFTVSVCPVHIEKGTCRQVASRGSTGAAGYVQGGSSPTACLPPDGVCARHARCLAPQRRRVTIWRCRMASRWKRQLACKGGRRVVVFTDTDAARYGSAQ